MINIGAQLFTFRNVLNELNDLKSVFGLLREEGGGSAQLSGLKFGYDAAECRALASDYGIELPLTHTPWKKIREETDKVIDDHLALGACMVGLGMMPGEYKNSDGLKRFTGEVNEVAEKLKAAGLLFGYHNHAHEFQKVEDKEVMYDYMLQHTDPEYVFFEMDVYWTVIGKASPVDYFKKYPGRFRVLHIKDEREIGQSGMVGFDAIFNNAKTAGVEKIVVEVERYSYDDVARSIRESIDYLKAAPFVPASYGK